MFRAFYDIPVIGGSIISVAGWHFLFRWLYPRIEIEGMARIKARKIVIGGIGAIIVTVIGTFLTKMLGW